MSLVDDLSTLFGVGPSSQASGANPPPGMANYGATPPAQGIAQSSPTAQVLARIKQPDQTSIASGSSNPLGLSPIPGGNDLGVAMQGLANVKPGQGKFSAFANGLAGALGARANASLENQQLGLKTLLANVEAAKTAQAIDMQNRLYGARSNAAAVLNGGTPQQSMPTPAAAPAMAPMNLPGGTAPPSQTSQGGPVPQLPAAGSPPPSGGAPQMPAPPSAGGAPDASSQPVSPSPKMIPHAVAALPDFWANVNPNSNPAYIDNQADQYERAAQASAMDPETSKRYSDSANQYRQRAQQIRTNGMVTLSDGSQALIPGFATSKATAAAIETAAQEQAKNQYAAGVTPSGAKYLPGAGGSPMPPLQGGQQQPGLPPQVGAMPPGAPSPQPSPTPSTLQIDPKTAAVQTAIPQAPPGGGYPLPNIPAGAKLTEVGEDAKELAKADTQFSDMVGKAPTLDTAIQRYQSTASALKMFQSGSGTDSLQAGAALADSYGFHGIAQGILGGDPAAVQWLKKEGVNLTLDTLKAAQPRFAQAEFTKVADQGVPSPENLPQANHQLVSEGVGSLMRSKAFIQDWQKAQQQGWQSPSAFYSQWSNANPLSGFVGAAQKQIGTFKGMDLPPSSDWVAGATYVLPKNLSDAQAAVFSKRGVAPGQMFRFNGRDASNAIQPFAPGQGYQAGQ